MSQGRLPSICTSHFPRSCSTVPLSRGDSSHGKLVVVRITNLLEASLHSHRLVSEVEEVGSMPYSPTRVGTMYRRHQPKGGYAREDAISLKTILTPAYLRRKTARWAHRIDPYALDLRAT